MSRRSWYSVPVFFLGAFLLFSGCTLFGSNDQPSGSTSLSGDQGEYNTLLGKTQESFTKEINDSLDLFSFPKKYEFTGNTKFTIKGKASEGEKSPLDATLSIESMGKLESGTSYQDILGFKGTTDIILKFTGTLPSPIGGTLVDALLSFSLQRLGEKFFFSIQDLSYKLLSSDGKTLPEIDFSSLKGEKYATTYSEILQRIGGGQAISTEDSLKMVQTLHTAFSEKALPLQYKSKVSEEGSRVTYAVDFDNELLKENLSAFFDFVQKSESFSPEVSPSFDLSAEYKKAIDSIAFEGTVTFDRNDSSFLKMDGSFVEKTKEPTDTASEKVPFSLVREGKNLSIKILNGGIKGFSLEKSIDAMSISSGGILFQLKNSENELTGSLGTLVASADSSQKLLNFAFKKENDVWNGSLVFPLPTLSPVTILVKNAVFDTKKLLKADLSLSDEKMGDLSLSYNIAITPVESISIEEPQNTQKLDVFLQKMSALVLGSMSSAGGSFQKGSDSIPASDALPVSPEAQLPEGTPEVSFEELPQLPVAE